MSRYLDGVNPLAYKGVKPLSPPNMNIPGIKPSSSPRDPTQNDINYNLGDFWLNTTTQGLWYLAAQGSHVVSGVNTRFSTWLMLAAGVGFLETLTGNTGGPIFPDAANNINVVGDGITVTVAGNPGTNTLTISAVGTGTVESLTGNTGGAVHPTAGNINTVGDGIGITVAGNPGTSTLTWSLVGGGIAGQTVTTDDGHVVAPSALGNWNFTGAHGINTSGVVATHTFTAAINNTITLGDLAIVTAGNSSVTLQSGDLTISGTGANAAGNINMPNTTSDERQGEIRVGGNRFMSNFGTNNTYLGQSSGSLLNTGATTGDNVAIGSNALTAISAGGTGANGNTAVGSSALRTYTFTTTAPYTGANTAVGAVALFACTTGGANTACGWNALSDLTTGNTNTAIGASALEVLTTGSSNIAIGESAGFNSGALAGVTTGSSNILIATLDNLTNYTGAESSNIIIQNSGVNAESNTIRIGTAGAGAGQQNRCFIAGIRGITTGVNNAIAVLIDSNGQLGTVSSSIRYKENVEDMDDFSDRIYGLRPVTFDYKNRSSERKSVGLIAEEVGEVMPDLVVFDQDGLPETVRYHDLVPMLLNEVQKLRRELDRLKDMVKHCPSC